MICRFQEVLSATCILFLTYSKASLIKTLAMSKHAAILILYKNCCVRWTFAYFLLHKVTHNGMPIFKIVAGTREIKSGGQSCSERHVCSVVSSILSRRPLKPLHRE